MCSRVSFFDKVKKLKEALRIQQGPFPTLGEVEDLLRDPDVRREFFRDIDSPSWVTPLREAGYFDAPPAASPGPDAQAQHPVWPESKYLARMAKHVPTEVAAIFADLDTDNASVIGNMLKAAVAMPAEAAATLVPALCQAAQEEILRQHPRETSGLCVHLAEGGEVSAAMNLADILFAPRFEEGHTEPSRRDVYWYKDGLKKVVPALAGREPRVFLPMLCGWLKDSVDAKKPVDPDPGWDDSYMWRPAIEEHDQNRDYDFAGVMTGFVREGFEQALRKGKISLEQAFGTLECYEYLVFKRIRLHLINEFADRNTELARRTMMDDGLFEDYTYKHEYSLLVGRRLDLLTPDERAEWLGWVDAGPDMSRFDEPFRETQGGDGTEEERRDRKRYWQFKKLHCVRAHLEGERRRFYEGMLAEHGEPELADLNFRSETARWANESPMTVAELAELTFGQAVEKVSSWQPDERDFGRTNLEGLASTFERYIASHPEALSAEASVLIGRPAIYVRVFIHQMAEAAKGAREIDIRAVLGLCRWVMEQPVSKRTTPEQRDGGLVDKDWQWTRDEISGFIKDVCTAKEDNAPKYPLDELREPMWHLLGELSRDRAESYVVRDISQDEPRVHDYLDLGINSPRGKAVGAALEYARWVANHIKSTSEGEEVVPGGLDAMPEVQGMMEWQIAPANRSVETLSIIGSRLGLLCWIDRDWLARSACRLFHLEGITETPPAPEGWAAWNAFLAWVRPHIEFYRLFQQQFAYAVTQSAQVELPDQPSERQPMNHLGEHLMLLYGRGQLGLDDDEGLLRRFLTDANPEIRRHAVSFVGSSMEGNENIPGEVVGRFQELWSVYWAGAGREDAERRRDAWLFGPWFASGQFPEQWALEQLEAFIEVTPTPEPTDAVVEQLAKIADTDIARAVRILDRIVRGDQEGWRTYECRDSAEQVLKTAMKASGDVRTQAKRLINYLGRRGYTEFGALLDLGHVSGSA